METINNRYMSAPSKKKRSRAWDSLVPLAVQSRSSTHVVVAQPPLNSMGEFDSQLTKKKQGETWDSLASMAVQSNSCTHVIVVKSH